MKKTKIIKANNISLEPVKLKDLSDLEDNITKIKYLKIARDRLDKHFLLSAIEELGMKGKKITAKKVKRILKKALSDIINETKQ